MKNMDTKVIIPVFNTLILPGADVALRAELPKAVADRMQADNNSVILMPLKNPVASEKAEPEDYYPIGVEGTVTRTAMTVSGRVFHIHVGKKGVLGENHVFFDGENDAGHWREGVFVPNQNEDQEIDDDTYRRLDVAAEAVNLTPADKYELLAADDDHRKDMIQRVFDTYEANQKKDSETREKSKERAARKDYRKKIDDAQMPEEALEEVNQVYERYMASQPNDPERGSMESYLDFMTALKWHVEDTNQEIDLGKARAILNRDHYGMDKVKERILQQLAVMTLRKDQAGSILLLVGAPGTGKTSMGKSIAEALGRKYARISLGGIRDEAEIRGHRRTYIGAMPGRIMDGIKKSGAMNPVVVLDEIDKIALGYEGDPSSALLEVLDPEQNTTFTDHYMNVPYDLSHVFFICTANTTDTIPGPLLDRMEVIQLSGYTPTEKMQIAKKYLFPRALKDAGLKENQLAVEDDALSRIIDEYTMEAGVRGLKKQLDVLCRHTAADIVEKKEEKEPVVVHASDVPSYLGNQHLIHDRILPKDTVGVVTGLAWTQVGGEILFIETRVMPGNGQIIITGQLGDVMKESARISVSLVKSLFRNDKLDFSDKDIHIHVPSGSVKKDGPSAGVTLFTALSSLVTNVPVPRDLAMTGEISLRGQVMPIGGLPEKLMAADRAGVTRVLIPKDNVQDLEDVPQETRDHLKIIPVDTVEDVLREALSIEVPECHTPMFSAGYKKVNA